MSLSSLQGCHGTATRGQRAKAHWRVVCRCAHTFDDEAKALVALLQRHLADVLDKVHMHLVQLIQLCLLLLSEEEEQ